MPPATVTAESARELFARYGYEPMEPYPGNISTGWNVRCTTCGAHRRVRYALLRADPERRTCKHGFKKNKVTLAEAEAFLAICGYVPTEPYPGNVSARWIVRCVTCGALRYLRVKDLRERPDKRTCKHRSRSRA